MLQSRAGYTKFGPFCSLCFLPVAFKNDGLIGASYGRMILNSRGR